MTRKFYNREKQLGISLANSLFGLVAAIILTALFSSCGKKEVKIEGEISGADKVLVTLEKPDFNGNWTLLDSTRTNSHGNFKFSRPPFDAPEILRISLEGHHIYIPVDSTETIKLKASKENFGIDYELEGSQNAALMAAFDRELVLLPKEISQDSLNRHKRLIFTRYIQPDPSSILSYYVLTKEIDGKALFNPYEGDDYKYFAAVATGFKNLRPDDPRTKLLEQTGLQALRERNSRLGKNRQIEAEEVTLLEISLPDENGETKNLSEVAAKGKPTLLVFSLMNTEDAPALNFALKQLLQEKGNSFNIYQVSFDEDRYAWRDAAKNLPWTTVYDSNGEYSSSALAYNIGILPSFFIYDRNGELSARAFTLEEAKEKL